MGKTAEEMQRAVDIYQSELAKLQQKALLAVSASNEETSPLNKDDSIAEDEKKPASPMDKDIDDSIAEKESSRYSPDQIKFSPLPNHLPTSLPPPPPFFSSSLQTEKGSSSPLQSMASITNSIITQPIPPPYRPNQRSFKAVLPPITQEQFDKCEGINTEDLVRRVGQSY